MQSNGDGGVNGNGGGQGHPACASCKHQRKKCTETCELAPYFPATRVDQFKKVHSVFGVSNTSKMLKKVAGHDRQRAVESLVWEAEWRHHEPILGPYGEYLRLLRENLMLRKEIQLRRCNNGVAGLNMNNIVIQNNSNNMHFMAPPPHPGTQDTINYIMHHDGNLILEQNNHAPPPPQYVRGMERDGVQIRNVYDAAVAPPNTSPMSTQTLRPMLSTHDDQDMHC